MIGGSLLLAFIFLAFDPNSALIALSFSVFFFALLMVVVLSIPNLVVFAICNYLLASRVNSLASFRVLSIGGLAASGLLEMVLFLGFSPADPDQYILAILFFGCYLLAATFTSLILVPPVNIRKWEVDDVLDEDMRRG
jgi:hypothetical protein